MVLSLTNTVTIKSGVTLTVRGTLEVGGELSGGNGGSDAAGHTAGRYARILMNSASEINVYETVNAFGYIDESETDNGSQVMVYNGGTLWQPFVLRDFQGGSIMNAVYNKISTYHSSPFNAFEFRNVTSLVRVNYGGNIKAWANLYAGSQHNHTDVNIVGTSNSIINLTDSTYSYVTAKYNRSTEIMDLDIYGGATSGSLTLKIKVIVSINVSTADVYFPISWRYDVSLNKNAEQTDNAIYTMNQRFKLMPGAIFSVEEGAELTINELNIYEKFTDEMAGSSGPVAHPYPFKDPAQFIVNGTVTATKLGGTVLTEKDSGARLNVTGAAELTTLEPKQITGSSFNSELVSVTTIRNNLKLYLDEGEKGLTSLPKSCATGTYYCKNKGWYASEAYIIYHANGGTFPEGSATQEGPYPTGETGYPLKSISAPKPSREHFTFNEKWYLDPECTVEAIGQTIFTSVYVYAGWTPVEYKLNYKDVYYEGESTDVSTKPANYRTTFNAALVENFFTVTNGAYEFGGWYYDIDCTERAYEFNGSELVDYLIGDTVTLYALWYPDGSATYIINYVNTNYEYSFRTSDSIVIVNENSWSSFKLPLLTQWDNDTNKTKYFAGWAVNGDGNDVANTEGFFTKDTANRFVSDGEGNMVCTLYAIWNDKDIINVSYKVTDDGSTFETKSSRIYYVPDTSVTISSNIYLKSGYAYKATLTNGSENVDVTFDTSITTTTFAHEVDLTIYNYKIYTVTLDITGSSSKVSSYSLTVDKYVDTATGKLVESSKTISSETTISVICGTNISSINAKASGTIWFATIKVSANGTQIASNDNGFRPDQNLTTSFSNVQGDVTIAINGS